MAGELFGCDRAPVAGEVAGRAADHPVITGKLDGHVVWIDRAADTNAHVEAFGDEIDNAIGEIEGQAQFRVALAKAKYMWGDMAASEASGRRYHQVTAYRGTAAGDARFHVIEFAQQQSGLLQQLFACFRQGEATRGSVHELYAKAFFQRVQAPAKNGGRHAFGKCCRCEATLLGDLNEAVELGISRHSIPQVWTETDFERFTRTNSTGMLHVNDKNVLIERCVFSAPATLQAMSHSTGVPMQSKAVLTQQEVSRILAAARDEAQKNGWNVAIAVVDDGGHPLAMERLDGCSAIGAYIAMEKARSAAMGRRETKGYEEMVNGGRTAFVTAPIVTALEGGVPVVYEGQVIGAVGVSGVKAEQDAQIAKAGIAALSA